MRTIAALALATALVAAAPSAAVAAPTIDPLAAPTATPAPVDRPEDEPGQLRWYGYKLLLADAASLTLVITGAGTDLAPVGIAGAGGLFLGAPVIHALEGRGGRGVASFVMRLALPLAGGALASWAHDRGNKSPECDCMGGFLATAGGMMLGLGTAMIVDAAFLGWRTEAPAREARKSSSFSMLPTLGIAPGGGSVGVGGRF